MQRVALFLGLLLACAPTAPPPAPVAANKPAPPPTPVTPPPAPAPAPPHAPPEDPYLWLEEVTADKALAWAKEQNARSTKELEGDARFKPLEQRLLGILDSKDKIPWIGKQGAHYYNFWRDDAHARGLWRRVKSLAEYRKPKPAWETVLDVDALAATEKEPWVWKGAACLYPKYERCLVFLSRGGADASVVREFDTKTKAFVPGGFSLPEAKSSIDWKDLDTVYVGTDQGPGTLTDSGYPRLSKEWKRGTPLAEAKLVFEAQKTDVSGGVHRTWDHGKPRDLAVRGITFYQTQYWLRAGDKLERIDLPESANLDVWDDQILITLRDDWTAGGKTWPKGSLLTTGFDAYRKGGRDFTALFTPKPNKSLSAVAQLKTALIVNELEDVHNRLYVWTRKGGKWTMRPHEVKGLGSFGAEPVDPTDSDEYWFVSNDFTQPYTLSHARLGKKPEKLKQSPAFFDASSLAVEQHFATSKDGTKVPYFQVSRKGLTLDGQNPTLLTGYGGFEVSLEPGYSPIAGAAWMERGGVFVQANIRGGGEYGPAWHQAALKTNRQRAYDDFAAIAEDLIARKVTSPKKLGIEGGSNGGLLVGVMLTQRPEIFGAVVCEVPLLDMKRFSGLLAGASWMSEYGDPKVPEEWAAIAKYSPYQNVKKDAKYPRTLFTTSTRDDRVHPGHARKMVARMTEQGHDVLYYENIEGGHGGAANNQQRAHMSALAYVFLARQLGL